MSRDLRAKIRRLELGKSQQWLAIKGGCSENAISQYETGRRYPPAEIRHRLAEALGKPDFELWSRPSFTGERLS